MSATIEEETFHRPTCDECGWEGFAWQAYSNALNEAQDHDEEHHTPALADVDGRDQT